MKTFIAAGVACAFVSCASMSAANTVHTIAWDETVDGDAGPLSRAENLGTLAPGGHFDVIGDVSLAVRGDGEDAFAFTTTTEFTIDITRFSPADPSNGFLQLLTATGGFIDGEGTGPTSGPSTDFFGVRGAGSYVLAFSERLGDPKTSYTFTINTAPVSAVPLPAGGALMLAGLGALGVMRRRKAA